MPGNKAAREAYAKTVGEDGYHLLDLLDAAPPGLADLPELAVLRRVWERRFSRDNDSGGDGAAGTRARLRPERELAKAAEATESPYDPDARYRSRFGVEWTGYLAHLTEACEAHGVSMIGPPRRDASWQARTAGGFSNEARHRLGQEASVLPARAREQLLAGVRRRRAGRVRGGALRNCHLQGVPVAIALHPLR